jgi:hypothetical protein
MRNERPFRQNTSTVYLAFVLLLITFLSSEHRKTKVSNYLSTWSSGRRGIRLQCIWFTCSHFWNEEKEKELIDPSKIHCHRQHASLNILALLAAAAAALALREILVRLSLSPSWPREHAQIIDSCSAMRFSLHLLCADNVVLRGDGTNLSGVAELGLPGLRVPSVKRPKDQIIATG